MLAPREAPYVWVTWLTRFMAGEAHCGWAAWFRAHHTFDRLPSNVSVAKWTAEHTAMVREYATTLRLEGYTILVEEQNAFKLRGRQGVTLAGKPDIVAWRSDDLRVIECKTGIPRTSDQLQVLIYMLVLPYALPVLWKGRTFHGQVQYRADRVDIPAEALDEPFKTLLRHTMAQVSGDIPLTRVPSVTECRLCDINASLCPERLESPSNEPSPVHELF
jgi:hypothetical protein